MEMVDRPTEQGLAWSLLGVDVPWMQLSALFTMRGHSEGNLGNMMTFAGGVDTFYPSATLLTKIDAVTIGLNRL